MCHAKTCRTCGKTTWAGCGHHIDAVRRTVPTNQWCAGHAGEGEVPVKRRWGLFR